jgi:hypothetical protein
MAPNHELRNLQPKALERGACTYSSRHVFAKRLLGHNIGATKINGFAEWYLYLAVNGATMKRGGICRAKIGYLNAPILRHNQKVLMRNRL